MSFFACPSAARADLVVLLDGIISGLRVLFSCDLFLATFIFQGFIFPGSLHPPEIKSIKNLPTEIRTQEKLHIYGIPINAAHACPVVHCGKFM